MLGKPNPLVEFDWPNFNPWAVAPVRHRISEHPLLQIDQLVELAKRLGRKGRIRNIGAELEQSTSGRSTTPLENSIAIQRYSRDTVARLLNLFATGIRPQQ